MAHLASWHDSILIDVAYSGQMQHLLTGAGLLLAISAGMRARGEPASGPMCPLGHPERRRQQKHGVLVPTDVLSTYQILPQDQG